MTSQAATRQAMKIVGRTAYCVLYDLGWMVMVMAAVPRHSHRPRSSFTSPRVSEVVSLVHYCSSPPSYTVNNYIPTWLRRSPRLSPSHGVPFTFTDLSPSATPEQLSYLDMDHQPIALPASAHTLPLLLKLILFSGHYISLSRPLPAPRDKRNQNQGCGCWETRPGDLHQKNHVTEVLYTVTTVTGSFFF
ncbi:uncharacterized protein LOC141530740 isoform X2 [Cotesia typhae]|uniref:uncharacterized protein LOC141530740 isoform X2 n=1 Tax=Cotesia typhae TaxID=2053667 RepID=UPI003D694177